MESLFLVVAPMSIGTLAIFILCLYKGEICPGQRGRLHKWLPAVFLPMLLSLPVGKGVLLPIGMIAIFLLHVKTGKTRVEGPRHWLILALVFMLLTWAWHVRLYDWPVVALSLLCIPLAGTAYAHWLLTVARTRLQAFHLILPITGIVSAMGVLLASVWYWSSLPESSMSISSSLMAVAGLLGALLLWVVHLYRRAPVVQWHLALVNIVMGIALLSLGL